MTSPSVSALIPVVAIEDRSSEILLLSARQIIDLSVPVDRRVLNYGY